MTTHDQIHTLTCSAQLLVCYCERFDFFVFIYFVNDGVLSQDEHLMCFGLFNASELNMKKCDLYIEVHNSNSITSTLLKDK